MTTAKEKFETKKLPMMPIRDVVIFPYMMTPFVVGRESSVRALEEALAQAAHLRQKEEHLVLEALQDILLSESVVTAYQAGNGLVNLVTPTSAVVMGGLAIARVGYGTWLRFVWPVLVLLGILTVVVLSIGVLLQ